MKRERTKALEKIITETEERLRELCKEAGIEDLSQKDYSSLWLSEFSVKKKGKEYPWVKLGGFTQEKKKVYVQGWREDLAPKELLRRIVRVYRALQHLRAARDLLLPI